MHIRFDNYLKPDALLDATWAWPTTSGLQDSGQKQKWKSATRLFFKLRCAQDGQTWRVFPVSYPLRSAVGDKKKSKDRKFGYTVCEDGVKINNFLKLMFFHSWPVSYRVIRRDILQKVSFYTLSVDQTLWRMHIAHLLSCRGFKLKPNDGVVAVLVETYKKKKTLCNIMRHNPQSVCWGWLSATYIKL